jgi:hypothetical protein
VYFALHTGRQFRRKALKNIVYRKKKGREGIGKKCELTIQALF